MGELEAIWISERQTGGIATTTGPRRFAENEDWLVSMGDDWGKWVGPAEALEGWDDECFETERMRCRPVGQWRRWHSGEKPCLRSALPLAVDSCIY
jgi:hypothetical protein